MITKDINGNNLSASYSTTVESPMREWQARLYSDGALLSCSIKRLSITKGSCGTTEAFSVGNVISNMLDAELLELSTDIKGTDIKVEIGLNTGSVEWICVGHFVAIEVIKTAYSTTVTGYGFSTAKASGGFVIPSTLSLGNIASAIQTATGCTVTFDSGINPTNVLAGTIDEGTSCYQGLQILAHACGGYAVDTYDGNFAIHKYNSTATLSVTTDRMKLLPNVEESAFTITGVSVTATGQYTYSLTTDTAIDPEKTYYTRSGTAPNYVYTPVDEPDVAYISTYYEQFDVVYTYGSPVVLYDENPNMSADVFNNIYKGVVGYSYKTGTIDLSLGDARIEGNDVLSVTDVNGDVYTIPCHLVTHTYDGGVSTTVQAVKATDNGDGLVSNAPITQKMDEISASTAIAKASAESAKASAETALQYAEVAKQTTDEINAYADLAGKTVTQILNDGETAGTMAQQAIIDAGNAYASANNAQKQLSIVENVVGTLQWVSEHGYYVLSEDDAVIPTKTYYTVTGVVISNPTGNPSRNGYYELVDGVYVLSTDTSVDSQKTYYQVTGTAVQNPTGDPSTSGYYELEIDQAIQQYINTHLALTDSGLSVTDGSRSSVLVSTNGVTIYGSNGQVVGQYGEGAIIGDQLSYHIEITGNELAFCYGERLPDHDNRVAYMTDQKLYIPMVVVTQSMQAGNWIWDASTDANHFTLKYIGA